MNASAQAARWQGLSTVWRSRRMAYPPTVSSTMQVRAVRAMTCSCAIAMDRLVEVRGETAEGPLCKASPRIWTRVTGASVVGGSPEHCRNGVAACDSGDGIDGRRSVHCLRLKCECWGKLMEGGLRAI
jgi:hypothetical protein